MKQEASFEKRLKEPIPVGVASCLLGTKVRYNGDDKYDEFIVENLGRYFQWTSVCPEFEAGFGVPRESMHLVNTKGKLRLTTTKTKLDVTQQMSSFVKNRVEQLKSMGLRGYLLKKASPSCGMERVRVYQSNGIPSYDGRGLFAAALIESMPNLPVEEEGRLHDSALRDNWVERVFAYHELRKMFEQSWKLGDIVAFHSRYKLTLLAHSTVAYQKLGRYVANAKKESKKAIEQTYETEFMSALSIPATPKKHVNVMQHMLGYLKKELEPSTKKDILVAIEDYRRGLYPLSVPLVLLGHYLKKHQITYLNEQSYLNPHPKELAIRR